MNPIFVLAYSAWALYSGYKILSGRWEWLDRKAPLSIICKLVLGFILGYFVAAFYLFYLFIKFCLWLLKTLI